MNYLNRREAVAGTFYPGSKDELLLSLETLMANGIPNTHPGNIIAIISPHAGYVYSGTVAASAYNQLSPDHIFDNIFLIGSSHHASFNGASVYSEGNFHTPLGTAKVNIPLSRKIIADHPDVFKWLPEVHEREHSLEVQVPFLQCIFKDDLQIIPVIIGTTNPSVIKKIADALQSYTRGNNLFVVSTDFSHYPDYDSAIAVDKSTADAILKNSPDQFLEVLKHNEEKNIQNLATSICGWTSVLTLLYITSELQGIRYHEIHYRNSGDVPYGDKRRVVGYHAIIVTRDDADQAAVETAYSLNDEEKSALLRIARLTIEEYLAKGKVVEAQSSEISERLKSPAGVFVTLMKDNGLRGCIGQFIADRPLHKIVQDMAIAAATRDYRFPKVTAEELKHIEIEISVLTPMQKIRSVDEIKLGIHGIYIRKGNNSGTFLPQVARQTGWDLEDFLGHCARDKAGLGWDEWKDAEIFVYEAYAFKEVTPSHGAGS